MWFVLCQHIFPSIFFLSETDTLAVQSPTWYRVVANIEVLLYMLHTDARCVSFGGSQHIHFHFLFKLFI